VAREQLPYSQEAGDMSFSIAQNVLSNSDSKLKSQISEAIQRALALDEARGYDFSAIKNFDVNKDDVVGKFLYEQSTYTWGGLFSSGTCYIKPEVLSSAEFIEKLASAMQTKYKLNEITEPPIGVDEQAVCKLLDAVQKGDITKLKELVVQIDKKPHPGVQLNVDQFANQLKRVSITEDSQVHEIVKQLTHVLHESFEPQVASKPPSSILRT
jgi:hypothetical protein